MPSNRLKSLQPRLQKLYRGISKCIIKPIYVLLKLYWGKKGIWKEKLHSLELILVITFFSQYTLKHGVFRNSLSGALTPPPPMKGWRQAEFRLASQGRWPLLVHIQTHFNLTYTWAQKGGGHCSSLLHWIRRLTHNGLELHFTTVCDVYSTVT